MVQLGFERHAARLPAWVLLSRCGPNHWTGLREERCCSSRSTNLFRDSAPNPQVFGDDDGNCSLDTAGLALEQRANGRRS
jgi:hypothetical protein